MAEQSKFSGALAKLNQRPVEREAKEPTPQEPTPQESEAKQPEVKQSKTVEPKAVGQKAKEPKTQGRGQEAPPEAPLNGTTNERSTAERARGGRPTGKRSDPDFQQTTLLLRKDTKRKAVRQLEDSGVHMDLSELVEKLLAEWTVR